MTFHTPTLPMAVLLSACLCACGGGSDPAPASSTALGLITAPSGFDFANFKKITPNASQLLSAVTAGSFSISDPARTYLSVWYLDTSGKQQLLAFMTWNSALALGNTGISVQVPGGITTVHYEIYDAANSMTGSLTP